MTATKQKQLTLKQELFVHEYLIVLNATQAAIRAGYSKKTAGSQGFDLLKKPEIAAAILQAAQERIDRTQVDADYVLYAAKELFERCMQQVEPVMIGQGKDRRQLQDDEGNYVLQFDSAGAARALKILGDHVNVNAFVGRGNEPSGGNDDEIIWTTKVVHMAKEEYQRKAN